MQCISPAIWLSSAAILCARYRPRAAQAFSTWITLRAASHQIAHPTWVPTSHTDTSHPSLHSPVQPQIQSTQSIPDDYFVPIFHHWWNRIGTYHIRNHLGLLSRALYSDLIEKRGRRYRVVNRLLGMLWFRALGMIRRIREMGGLRRRELRSYLSDIMYPPEHPTLDVRDQKRRSCTYRSIPFLVIIRLLRSLSGLNFVGIDSHVLRPMITAFWVFWGLVDVTLSSALCCSSSFPFYCISIVLREPAVRSKL